ncbi:DUF4429 domain-containing protein [Sphingomonas sp. QA11]|uniref:DUF4429 domain-containing protein n=1 Tax=Sphingomonas sp. QA11 TaxID=2950605 RepID=UPI00234B79B1|nr:DUF4429 domain-containing protein [Sphingomonas sp. QA11]WCM29210.1 DUF4429 domain-containing protein [Sphingomonas sp. QA11]
MGKIYDGRNAGNSVELLDDGLVIRRKGIVSLLNHGLKGEKRIPYASITSIQFKEPGLTTGYIQFGVAGGVEGRGGVMNAVKDENSVVFVKKVLADFRELRDEVEKRSAVARGSGARGGRESTGSIADELNKLADLRDRGILSGAEFDKQKAVLLGAG